jgi:hypothetical protein
MVTKSEESMTVIRVHHISTKAQKKSNALLKKSNAAATKTDAAATRQKVMERIKGARGRKNMAIH